MTDTVAWRVQALEAWRKEIDALKPDVLAERQDRLREDVQEIRKDISAVKKLLITLIVTIAASAVGFAFTVLTATGRL